MSRLPIPIKLILLALTFVFLKDSHFLFNIKWLCYHFQSAVYKEFIDTVVLTILNSLDVNKPAEIDNSNPKVLRYCALPLLKPICDLFTISLTTSSIPTQWCTHCVTPVYKSGDKSLVSNYQPISLLCILSKVLEKLIYNKIMYHLENSFTKHQYGFLPGRSALQQLLLFTENLLEAKSIQAEVDVIYMDFRKAFDSIFPNGLLMKLKSVGIIGKLWLWLQTCLKYHFQCVRIGNSTSEYCDILSGVPRVVSWVLCCLSYSLMIFLKVSTLWLHSYLPMILNASCQLNHQTMLPNYKMTLTPYPPGATPKSPIQWV